jgi:hypothetical protein
MSREVFGFLDYGKYKIYRRGAECFASAKDADRLRRVKLPNRAAAESLAKTPLREVGQAIEKRLFMAKVSGSPAYYEVMHGR